MAVLLLGNTARPSCDCLSRCAWVDRAGRTLHIFSGFCLPFLPAAEAPFPFDVYEVVLDRDAVKTWSKVQMKA